MNYLGIDMGGTQIRLALGTERGRILRRAALRTYEGGKTPVENLAAAVESFLDGWTGARPGAIGVACGGIVDPSRRRIRYGTDVISGLSGCRLFEVLERRTGLPVRVENDTKVAALGEWRFGEGRRHASLAVVGVGTGLSAGLVLNGRLWRGAGGAAGEIGHAVVREDGPRCVCGKRGCLEAYASGSGLRARAREAVRRGRSPALRAVAKSAGELSAADVFRAARRGDREARRLVREAATYLGRAVGNLIVGLNVEAVVFFGSVILGNADYFEAVRETARRGFLPRVQGRVRIVRSRLGPDIGLKGALALAAAPRMGGKLKVADTVRAPPRHASLATGRQRHRERGRRA